MSNIMIVAEMSGNHNGSLKAAIEIIKAAKKAGADAIKLQTYTADTLTLNVRKPEFMTNPKGPWAGSTAYELYQKAYTPWDWQPELFHIAKEEGLICFSSPFDKTAVDFLEDLGNPIYKVASPEITDIPLIEYIAKKGKPVVLSSGIATKDDLQLAIDTCRKVGNNDITVLKCTTAYPTPYEECNLKMIPVYASTFRVKAGLSDHTLGSVAPIVAATLGATMIEKHFIIDRNLGGPDAAFSMNKDEFAQMVKDVHIAEATLGSTSFELSQSNKMGRRDARSLYVAEDVKAGDEITEKNVRSVRPGYGLHPKYLPQILGKHFTQDLHKGDRMKLEYVK